MPLGSVDSQQSLKNSMTRRFYSRSEVTGKITLPAVPAMIDEYVKMCDGMFADVGRKFSEEELAHLRSVLEGQLAQAYSASPRSSIIISFNAPVGPTLELRGQCALVDRGGRLRKLDRHPQGPAVRYRTRRSGGGAG